jgi:MoxR-like ATPase
LDYAERREINNWLKGKAGRPYKRSWAGIIKSGYNCHICEEYRRAGSFYVREEPDIHPICVNCCARYGPISPVWEGPKEGMDEEYWDDMKERKITILFDDTTDEVKTMDGKTGFDETELAEEPTPDEVVEVVEVEEPKVHVPTVISKLKGSVAVPEEFKFADNAVFYTMLRNIFRGKSILVTGPSGCGKSSLGKILADITNKPYYAFNFGDTMNPAAKLLGDTKYNSDKGTWFQQSRFVAALLDKKGAFIMLDEVTRDRTGDLANILMPVLDGQKYLALDESDEADTVDIHEGAFFYATANIGREYLGAAHDLDRAWKDRFTGGIYELEYLPAKREAELLKIRTPTISDEDASHITDFARRIRELYKAEELSTAVSTRMCLAAAEFVIDGMSLIEALKQVCLPFYPVIGGDDSERVRVVQTIQSMGE